MLWFIAAIVIAVYIFVFALMDAAHRADRWSENHYGGAEDENQAK